jgi:glycosyltransferase involved in cell wall biosynthesis
MRVSVIVPIYNEENTIEIIHEAILSTGIPEEIIYVNDGSTDGTSKILSALGINQKIKVISHPKNQGKGAAITTGVENARCDVVILQDADLEYDPREYNRLLAPFKDPAVQVVYGARFKQHTHHAFYLPHYLANRMLTFLTNLLFDCNLNDMETGYKVFRKSLFSELEIKSTGFEFEPEFTAKLLIKGYQIEEVPISFNPRNYKQGKKIKLSDAIKAVFTLFRIRVENHKYHPHH